MIFIIISNGNGIRSNDTRVDLTNINGYYVAQFYDSLKMKEKVIRILLSFFYFLYLKKRFKMSRLKEFFFRLDRIILRWWLEKYTRA